MNRAQSHRRTSPRAAAGIGCVVVLVVLAGTRPCTASDVQLTPDRTQTLISKDVGGERWAIVADRAQGTVSGNVYRLDGGPPQLVSCLELSRTGGEVRLRCRGTRSCDAWADLGDVTLPESFFEPPATCSSSTATASAAIAPALADAPGSALRLTPGQRTTLISKDVGGLRWAIARATRGETITGNVFSPDGGRAQFVWCELSGYERGDPKFSCSGAVGCGCAPCAASDWTTLGETTLPRSFVEDRRCADGVEKPQPGGESLVPSDPEQVVSFGKVVAATADRVIATTLRGAGRIPGVEVFERVGGTWRAMAKLAASDPSDRDFGLTLALGGDTVVVGSEKRAYVFERGPQGWREAAMLGPFGDGDDEAYLPAVVTDGRIVALAATYPVNATLVFERSGTGWQQTATLRPGGPDAPDAPESLALAEGVLVAGSPAADGCGAARVYQKERGAWQKVDEFRGSGCPRIISFGSSVAISGATLLVGADPGRDADERRHDGYAFVFERRDGAWQEVARLDSCARDLGRFGSVLALSGERALVAAPSYDGGGAAGDVFVFERTATGWREQGKLAVSDAAPTGGFARYVAFAGDTAIVGAADRSALYAFDLAAADLLPPDECEPTPTPTPHPSVWPLDGWRVEPPQDHGMSAIVLERARDYAFRPGKHTQGVVIVRHGVIVAEWYEPGRDQDSFAASWSVAKSFAGALVGIAIGDGLIDGVDVGMARFFPDWVGTDKEAIALGDVLAMASGLDWSEDYSVFQTDLSDIAILASQVSDHLEYVSKQPLRFAPGSTFNYSSGDTMLLSGVLEVATGMRAADYAQQALFGPLGMAPVEWWRDVHGHTLTYCCIDTPTRELAKFGLLYARGGRWGDRRVVPADWVRASTSGKVASFYGYQWWLDTDEFLPLGSDVFMARGFDGQYVYVSPRLDLVVVRSGHYDKAAAAPVADPNLFARYPASGLGNGLGTIPPDGWDDRQFFRVILESIVE